MGHQGVITMRIALALTAAVFSLAVSAHSASAQFSGGGGGTVGCDPGLPMAMTSATQCRLFFKEELYGPCANPYNASWHDCAAAPAVRHHKTYKKRSKHKSGPSGGSAY
jgi:hypothetical protein